MGDGPNIPWRLLEIDVLVEDKETGGKFDLKAVLPVLIYIFLRWKTTSAFFTSSIHSSINTK